METATIDPVDGLRAECGDGVVKVDILSERRAYVEVRADALPAAARYLWESCGGRLMTCSGMQVQGGFEILYHFAFDEACRVVSLRVRLPGASPSMPSIAGWLPAAEFIEREMHELLGIDFPGHPNMRHLLLVDDWPECNFPLRLRDDKSG